jgi:hypothetical protein
MRDACQCPLLAGSVSSHRAGKLTFHARAWPAKGSFPLPSGSHAPGHFQSFKHQENHVANDRSQVTADVARRPTAVTHSPKRPLKDLRCPPASMADRMSAGQGIEKALPTQRSLWRFSGRLTGSACKRPFAELVAKIRVREQQSFADTYRRWEQHRNGMAGFKIATGRSRPAVVGRTSQKQAVA